jgi:ABC-type polysaccharide/polyol phosphate transport system ATPase subunit
MAVVARGLGKRFDIYQSDRGRLWEFFGNRKHHVEFWALRDVSFSIPRGSAFGVVGSNGAGKSTLIRMMSGVSQPTEGVLQINASRPGLLDMDLGFHPDFTGRENINLNCAVMGIPDDRVAELIPQIVEFAELEDFIDFPVRTYSTGMQMRLGFSMATHMNYDVIFIDEVLAVGDQYFQRKCIRKIEEFISDGKTLVLVSHDLHSVRSLCDEVVWLHAGRVVAAGDTQEVVNAYVDVARDREGRIKARIFGGADSAHSRAMARRVEDDRPEATGRSAPVDATPLPYFCTSRDPELEAMVREATWLPDATTELAKTEVVADYEQTHGERPIITGTGEVRILRVRTLDSEGREKDNFTTGEALTVACTFKTLVPVENPVLGIALFRNDELYVYGPNTRFDEVRKMEGTYDGVYTFFISYPRLPLLNGVYRISVALYDKGHIRPHCWHNQLYEIRVSCARDDHGVIEIPHHWGLITHASGAEEDLP